MAPIGAWGGYEELGAALLDKYKENYGIDEIEAPYKIKADQTKSGAKYNLDAAGLVDGQIELIIESKLRSTNSNAVRANT